MKTCGCSKCFKKFKSKYTYTIIPILTGLGFLEIKIPLICKSCLKEFISWWKEKIVK